jgi:hypothetical protein
MPVEHRHARPLGECRRDGDRIEVAHAAQGTSHDVRF